MTTRRDFHKVAGAAALASLAAPAVVQAQNAHKWKMQSLWQAGSVNQKIFDDWTKKVKEITGGRIEIEPLPVGSIVAYTETLGAMRDGVLDAHHSGAPYASGLEPGLALLGDLNGGFETPYQMQMWFEYGGGIDLAREIYKRFNTFYVGPVWWGVESVPAKKPLRTLAEFKGVKMRVPEGLGAEIWRRAGVGVVTLPGSEVYTALDRGVIEATDWGTLGMNNDLGYHKIAKYPLHPGFHSMPCAEVAVNMTKWNALSARSQGSHGSGCARLRARYGAAHCSRGYEGGRAGQGRGVRIGQLEWRRAPQVSSAVRRILGCLGQEKLDRAESLRQPDRFPEKTAAAVDWFARSSLDRKRRLQDVRASKVWRWKSCRLSIGFRSRSVAH